MKTRIKPLGGHGVVSRTELLASGMKRSTLANFVETGHIVRLDRSRFALPGTEHDIVTAVREGGTLTCMSALKLAGVSVLEDGLVHLRRPACRRRDTNWVEGVSECCLPITANSAAANPAATGTEWPDHPLDGLDAALRVACTNHSDEEVAVVLDSVLHTRLRDRPSLHALLDDHSARAKRLARLADAGSESILESVVRHRLKSRRISVRTQVTIQGLGRVDTLLGKSLIIETDGFAFHSDRDSFREDRRRDRTALALGYSVIRLTWEQIMGAWPTAMADIASVVSARRHLKPPRKTAPNAEMAVLVPRAS